MARKLWMNSYIICLNERGRRDFEISSASGHIPPLPASLPFLSSDDDTTDGDTPDTPPSPTHDTPFTEITASTQRSPVIPRRRVMILSPGQPIPHGRPYRYHPNGPAIPVHRIQTTKGIQGEQGRRIVGVESAVTALTERVAELERDNQRLRGTASVESQRVDRLQPGMKMPNTRSRASMTHEGVEELIAHRVAEEMKAREVTRNLEALNENEEEQEGENGGNENGGNEGNGNGDNGGNGNRGNIMKTMEIMA
nr:hypothetical protein [Tanacetum cinerariifolium]